MTTVVFFPLERVVIFREHGNGSYSIASYYIARVVVACFYQCVYSGVFGTILYWMVGFYPSAQAFFTFLGNRNLPPCARIPQF